MNRLKTIPKTKRLEGIRIVITGCGYKPLQTTFYDIVTNEPSQDSIYVEGKEMKLNIGSATAGVLARNGATVHIVSNSESKLRNLKKGLEEIIDNGEIDFSAVDLVNEYEVKEFVNRIKKDKPIYWVQSVGLGAGSYNLKDDPPRPKGRGIS